MADKMDMYAGLGDEAAESGPGPANDGDDQDKDETPDEKSEDEGAGQSALIPKFLGAGKDFQPGDEIVLKIVADRGDDGYEVEYATGKDEDKKSKGGEMDGDRPKGAAYKGIGDRMQAMVGGRY
jgi:hypothetical protein